MSSGWSELMDNVRDQLRQAQSLGSVKEVGIGTWRPRNAAGRALIGQLNNRIAERFKSQERFGE